MRKFNLLVLFSLFFLVACSGIPLRLKRTADENMRVLNAEMAVAIEGANHNKPVLTETYQVTEEKWCLTYELGPDFSFSSLWEKQEKDWVRLELQPYVNNCNWAH